MTVKAKFRCYGKFANGSTHNSQQTTLQFHAVYGSEGENVDYSKYTPSGSLMMNIDDGTTAADLFVVGEDYYLTFEKAPALTPVV